MKKIEEIRFDGTEIFDKYYKELIFENIYIDDRMDVMDLCMKLVSNVNQRYEYDGHKIETDKDYEDSRYNLRILVSMNID